MLLLNAFSLNMIEAPAVIDVTEVSVADASGLYSAACADCDRDGPSTPSAVGHADTAKVFSSVLGLEVPCNRATVALKKGDSVLVGQYKGPRLPEGATTLPAGATIQWLLVALT